MTIDAMTIVKYAALIVAVTMVANAVFLAGFSRHRLRAYNVYIVFSIALVAARLYMQLETGLALDWELAAVWVNLAVGAIIGLIGMMRLAQRDPQVWSRRDHR